MLENLFKKRRESIEHNDVWNPESVAFHERKDYESGFHQDREIDKVVLHFRESDWHKEQQWLSYRPAECLLYASLFYLKETIGDLDAPELSNAIHQFWESNDVHSAYNLFEEHIEKRDCSGVETHVKKPYQEYLHFGRISEYFSIPMREFAKKEQQYYASLQENECLETESDKDDLERE